MNDDRKAFMNEKEAWTKKRQEEETDLKQRDSAVNDKEKKQEIKQEELDNYSLDLDRKAVDIKKREAEADAGFLANQIKVPAETI